MFAPRRRFHFVTLLLVMMACRSYGQTPTLTPAQAAAITAAESRTNDALGEFKYASITYEVVAVGPAKQGPITPKPEPGTLSVAVVEHQTGGKMPQSSQGFQPVIYWLVPQPDGTWATGYLNGHVAGYVRTGDTYPTAAAAKDWLVPQEQKLVTGGDLKKIGGAASALAYALPALLIGAIIVIGLLTMPIWMVVISQKKGAVPEQVICPGCNTVNHPRPGPCGNCLSTATFLAKRKNKKGFFDITTICSKCKNWTQTDTYCVACETDLKQQMLSGYGKLMAAK